MYQMSVEERHIIALKARVTELEIELAKAKAEVERLRIVNNKILKGQYIPTKSNIVDGKCPHGTYEKYQYLCEECEKDSI